MNNKLVSSAAAERRVKNFHSRGWPSARVPDPALAILFPSLLFFYGLSDAGVAQLVEHLICNQRVGGSSPFASSRFKDMSAPSA